MKQKWILGLCFFSVLSFSESSENKNFEAPPKPTEVKEKVEPTAPSGRSQRGMYLGIFQLGAGMMMDTGNRVRGAGAISWVPTYQFSPTVWAKFNVGVLWRYFLSNDSFRVGDIGLTILERPKFNSPLFGEIGAGFQYWTREAARKFYPQVKAAVGYQFGDGRGFVKSFQLNYAYVFHSPLIAHQLIGTFSVGF